MNGSSFETEDSDRGTRIVVSPVPGGNNIGAFVTLLILGTVCAVIGLVGRVPILDVIALLCFAMTYVVHLGNKRNRRGGDFTISRSEIIVGEKHISLHKVDGLFIRNAISEEKQSVDPAYLALGGGMAMRSDWATSSIGAMHLARASVAAKRKRRQATSSWLVAIESNGQAITLASGLTDVTARGVVAEVQRQIASPK